MPGKILNGELRSLVGAPIFAQGEAYFKEGLVRHVELTPQADASLDDSTVSLTAAVGGRGVAPHQQRLTLKWDAKKRMQLVGNCTCPARFNCKHVVAVCLAAKRHWRGQWLTSGIPARWTAASAQVSRSGVNSLERKATHVGQTAPKPVDTTAKTALADAVGEQIIYVVHPLPALHALGVAVISMNPAETGTDWRQVELESLQNPYFRPPYATEGDTEIARQLLGAQLCEPATDANGAAFVRCVIKGSAGALAVRKMVQQERAVWQPAVSLAEMQRQVIAGSASRMRVGAKRKLDMYWRETEAQAAQLQLSLCVGDAQGSAADKAQLVLTEPLLYVARTGDRVEVGELDTQGLNAAQVQQLLTAPVMSADKAAVFSEELSRRHEAIGLQPPRQLETRELKGVRPVSHLTLTRVPTGLGLSQQGDFAIRWQCQYQDVLLNPANGRPRTLKERGDHLLAVHRDGEAEAGDAELLAAQGLVALYGEDGGCWWVLREVETVTHAGERMPVTRQQQITAWAHLLDTFLPEREAAGWAVVREDVFSLSFFKADTYWGTVEESTHDWFDLRLDVEIQGRRVSLLKLLLPILDEFSPAQLPETLYIPLQDDQYFPVSSEEIRPFLQTLYELYDFISPDAERLRLSRYDVRALAELEAAQQALPDSLSRQRAALQWQGGEQWKALGARLRNFQGIQHCPVPVGFLGELRDYQQQGLNWLAFLREYDFNGVLADDMGLGKTVQTIAHLLNEKHAGRLGSTASGALPALVVAPTSLMGNWRREIALFAPELSVLVLQGQDRHKQYAHLHEADILLTTYPLLPRDAHQLESMSYHLLVLDEAQMIKNPKSKAALAARRLEARHRLCLTGTPMENHLGELWAHFDFLMPGFLGDAKTFKKSYQTPIEKHGDLERQAALAKRVAPFMLRRKKDEVERELPPKTEMIRSVPLGKSQAALYETIRISMEARVRQSIASKGLARSHITILDALLKLRQICCDPRLLKLDQARQVKESAKLEMLMEMLPELLDEGRRVLIFSQFVSMLKLISAELDAAETGYVVLTGETQKRDEVIEQFNAGEADVFLISLKAGGVGLNLTRADTVILYDPWWNPAVEAQAMDRTHRIGQDKPVFVYKLLTERTVEEKILALQESKKALAEGVYQQGADQAAFDKAFNGEMLNELFSEELSEPGGR